MESLKNTDLYFHKQHSTSDNFLQVTNVEKKKPAIPPLLLKTN